MPPRPPLTVVRIYDHFGQYELRLTCTTHDEPDGAVGRSRADSRRCGAAPSCLAVHSGTCFPLGLPPTIRYVHAVGPGIPHSSLSGHIRSQCVRPLRFPRRCHYRARVQPRAHRVEIPSELYRRSYPAGAGRPHGRRLVALPRWVEQALGPSQMQLLRIDRDAHGTTTASYSHCFIRRAVANECRSVGTLSF
jgi:hypothetical protein